MLASTMKDSMSELTGWCLRRPPQPLSGSVLKHQSNLIPQDPTVCQDLELREPAAGSTPTKVDSTEQSIIRLRSFIDDSTSE